MRIQKRGRRSGNRSCDVIFLCTGTRVTNCLLSGSHHPLETCMISMHAQTNNSQLSSLFLLDPLLYCRSSVSYRRSELWTEANKPLLHQGPAQKFKIEPSIRFNIAYLEALFFPAFRACNTANCLALLTFLLLVTSFTYI